MSGCPGPWLSSGAPAGDLEYLLAAQWATSIGAQVDHTHQCGQRVDGRGAFTDHVVASCHQDA